LPNASLNGFRREVATVRIDERESLDIVSIGQRHDEISAIDFDRPRERGRLRSGGRITASRWVAITTACERGE
jgi:hypothetical protein